METLLAPSRFWPMVPDARVRAVVTKRPATRSLGSLRAVKGEGPIPQLSSRTTTSRGILRHVEGRRASGGHDAIPSVVEPDVELVLSATRGPGDGVRLVDVAG